MKPDRRREVVDSVEDLRNAGLSNGKPSVGIVLSRQPGANIIKAVDVVKAELPRLAASLPGDVDLNVVVDRSITIRGSLADTERTLITAVVLVILVVFVFLRNVRAAAIPSVAVPVSIIGSFGAMYLLGFSLDNLSLMALTISTGFVVDDAIVVLENVTRHIEEGETRLQAAILGAREVGFTVISISLSLIAVFLPLLLMGSIVGRLFREFAMTLSIAVLISLVVSLTTTPMMCSLILPKRAVLTHGALYRITERGFDAMLAFYRVTLAMALRHPLIVVLVLFAHDRAERLALRTMTYSLFPVQDTGLLIGSIQGDQSISFQSMKQKLTQLQTIVQDDPAVATVVGVTGGRQTNSGFVYISLKPLRSASVTADQVVARLRGKLAAVAGARLFLVAVSDLRTGGRQSNATYQYTLLSDDTTTLYEWAPRLTAALQKSDILKDVNSDQQQGGLETDLDDRPPDRHAPRPDDERDRQHALRRLRAAAGVDHLQRAQPVSRRHGGRAALLAGSRRRCATSGFRPPAPIRRGTQQHQRASPAPIRRPGGLDEFDLQHRGPIAADSARNLAMNSLARQRPFQRLLRRRGLDLDRDDDPALPRSPFRARAARRSASTTRASSSPRRSRSTSRRVTRSARRKRRSPRRAAKSACPRPFAAPSPAPPRPSSNRSRRCRCCSPRR